MKLNRKWLMVIALVLSLTMATAGTLAYLTDRDTEVNVFTMGNVDIELKEDFEQDSELIPGIDIEKKPTITNIGKNDAWVWATIAIPSALDDDDASANVVHFNMSKDSVAEGKWTWWEEGTRDKWLKEYDVEYEGVKYNVFTVLYQTALKKGDTTEPVIYKVYMDDHVDIAPDGQLHHVENGKVTKLDWNINTNGNPKIYVSAYAMQTNEFADVYDAYEAYTAQWSTSGNAKDVIAWGEDDEVTDSGIPMFYEGDPAELAKALSEATDAGSGNVTITLDDNYDMTGIDWDPISVDGYHGAGIVTVEGNGHTIKGLNAPLFAGGFAGKSGIVIKDLTIADSDIVSTHSTGAGAFIENADSMATITLTNCHLKNSDLSTTASGPRMGGLIGWVSGYAKENDGPVKSYVTVKDCSVENVTMSAAGSVGGLIGHAGASDYTWVTIENCEVKDCTLNSTDDGEWRVGVAVGTANNGHVVINDIEKSGNVLTQTGKTAPDHSDLYGRFVPSGTGTLTIDGVDIN